MNKAAVITGASDGIGLELARLFARDKHDLVLVARRRERLERLASELRSAHGVQCDVVALDLSEPNAPSELLSYLTEHEIHVDTLVNNAGFGVFGKFVDTDLEREMRMIQLNIAALTELTKRVLPDMLKRRDGHILNVASTAAFQPGPLMAVYYATKAYVLSFSEAIAEELKGTGVTVTALCPGPTRSGFQAAAHIDTAKLLKGHVPDSAEVAQAGYAAMKANRRVYIHGSANWLLAQATRLAPRKLVTNIVYRLQRSLRA